MMKRAHKRWVRQHRVQYLFWTTFNGLPKKKMRSFSCRVFSVFSISCVCKNFLFRFCSLTLSINHANIDNFYSHWWWHIILVDVRNMLLCYAKDNVLLMLSHLLYDSARHVFDCALRHICVYAKLGHFLIPNSKCFLYRLEHRNVCFIQWALLLIVFVFSHFSISSSKFFCSRICIHICPFGCIILLSIWNVYYSPMYVFYFFPVVFWKNNNNWIHMKYICDVHFAWTWVWYFLARKNVKVLKRIHSVLLFEISMVLISLRWEYEKPFFYTI